MKKSTLLSLLTATSIILTSAGTYALWDTIQTNTSSESVTFRHPVTVAVSDFSVETTGTNIGVDETITATASANFTVVNKDDLAKSLIIIPEIEDSSVDGVKVDINDFEIELSDTHGKLNQVNKMNISEGFYDTNLEGVDGTSTHDITVTVTPKTGSIENIVGKNLNISLTAKLSETSYGEE